ncbi:MAG TPA: hypothetical protein VIK60_01600 [Vicinamibacterales bacterium]
MHHDIALGATSDSTSEALRTSSYQNCSRPLFVSSTQGSWQFLEW